MKVSRLRGCCTGAAWLSSVRAVRCLVKSTNERIMGRRDIHVGQLVQPGELLARIVEDDDVWIIANYRETQMNHIRTGNLVSIKADAVPDVEFEGRVQALSAATGSAYSSVPVDNATGNFVKVEQRVPVRIVLTKNKSNNCISLPTNIFFSNPSLSNNWFIIPLISRLPLFVSNLNI